MRVYLPLLIEALGGRSVAPAAVVSPPKASNRLSQASKPKITVSRSSDAAPAENVVKYSPAPKSDTKAEAHAVSVAHAVSKLAFARDITNDIPGHTFSTVEIDGRSNEGSLICECCGKELGDGKRFKFVIDGKTEFVHSRCMSCAICRKDFVTGMFYLSEKGGLVTLFGPISCQFGSFSHRFFP